jgi:hypothetical protein
MAGRGTLVEIPQNRGLCALACFGLPLSFAFLFFSLLFSSFLMFSYSFSYTFLCFSLLFLGLETREKKWKSRGKTKEKKRQEMKRKEKEKKRKGKAEKSREKQKKRKPPPLLLCGNSPPKVIAREACRAQNAIIICPPMFRGA